MDLSYEIADSIATITLNRPARKNAFTFEMIEDWARALREAATDPAVRVVVLTGGGKGFCSGIDLDDLLAVEDTPQAHKNMLHERIHQVARALEDLDKPVIAAVNGDAVGAGLDMALMCDMRFVARSARLSEGYIRLGLVPGDGGCWYLPRLVGQAKALELLLSGDFVDAEEALRIGMVNRVYEDDQLMAQTYAFAARLAQNPPLPMSLIKRTVRMGERMDVRAGLDLISSHMAVVMSTDASREAMSGMRENLRGGRA